jgi:hypothetical protein
LSDATRVGAAALSGAAARLGTASKTDARINASPFPAITDHVLVTIVEQVRSACEELKPRLDRVSDARVRQPIAFQVNQFVRSFIALVAM